MSKLLGKIKRVASFRSTRSSSSRASANMDVNPPSPAVGQSSRAAYREERSTSRKAVEAPWGPREGRIQKVEEQGFRPYSDL